MIVETSGWRHLKEKNKLFLSCEYQKMYHPSPKTAQLSKIAANRKWLGQSQRLARTKTAILEASCDMPRMTVLNHCTTVHRIAITYSSSCASSSSSSSTSSSPVTRMSKVEEEAHEQFHWSRRRQRQMQSQLKSPPPRNKGHWTGPRAAVSVKSPGSKSIPSFRLTN